MCFSCFKGSLFWHLVCFLLFSPQKHFCWVWKYIPLQSHKLSVCETWNPLFKKICWKAIKTLCTINRRPTSPSSSGSQIFVILKNYLIPVREESPRYFLMDQPPKALISVSEPHRSVLSAVAERTLCIEFSQKCYKITCIGERSQPVNVWIFCLEWFSKINNSLKRKKAQFSQFIAMQINRLTSAAAPSCIRVVGFKDVVLFVQLPWQQFQFCWIFLEKKYFNNSIDSLILKNNALLAEWLTTC